MAITKIHAIKSTLGKALAYIENPDKTDGQMLVSGYNCEPQTAWIGWDSWIQFGASSCPVPFPPFPSLL